MRVPDFSPARVTVCGDVMLDRYWTGRASRISPEAPVPVVRVHAHVDRAGGAANVALNLRALGAHCQVLGVVGNDEAGALLAQRLREAGVGESLVRGRARTIEKLRVMSHHQQLLRIDFEDTPTPEDFDPEDLARAFSAALAGGGVAVLSDYGKGALRGVAGLIALARKAGQAVLIDPKGLDWSGYRGATLLTPNWGEFTAVAGDCPDEARLCERGEALRSQLQLEALLITRGEHGMSLIRGGHAPLHLPAMAREVFDVTGAGDTVIATLAAALATGTGLDDACRLANLAAGIVVGKLGAATASPAELQAAVADPGDATPLDEEALVQVLAGARAAGEKVVMTNGCFDLLHRGHLEYLRAARALGDRLVVAVNDDASVRRLKGPTRPVNRVEDRMAALAALRFVDHVLPFSEDTPTRLIERLAPDVLVKGGDYRPEEIAGGAAVRARGGEVVVLPFVEGYSTTDILRRGQA
jgi:D-beta-D-heptose 7-phosphate kinase/D-beta-D-heptose 1-phosphate adenosyltransferase